MSNNSAKSAAAAPAARVAYIRHGPWCPDGTWAAVPFWLAQSAETRARLEVLLGEAADFDYAAAKEADREWSPDLRAAAAEGLPLFLPAKPGDYPPQDLLAGYHVYLLDYCYTAEALEALLTEVGPDGKVTILDHHATNERVVADALERHPGRIEAVFDMERSGAEIAWDYAREHKIYEGPVSHIMRYVGDRDTWRWALPNSHEVNAALRIKDCSSSLGKAAAAYADELKTGSVETVRALAAAGANHLEAQTEIVTAVARGAKVAHVTAKDPATGGLAEYRVRVVNCPTLQSEIGHAAATLEIEAGVLPDFAAVWYYTHASDEVRISLRRGHPAVDLSKVAPTIVGALSGGGHPGAAGCAVKGSDIKSIFRAHPDPSLAPRTDKAEAGKADE